jgi:hypothetical protein
VTHNFDDLKAELPREPAVRAEYDARAEEFEERVAFVTDRSAAALQ